MDFFFWYGNSFYFEKNFPLRKLFAILLLCIYLFNLVGYQFLFSFVMHQSDERLVTRLDKNQYNEEDLVQISIPTHLPYFNSQTEFERVDGEITHNGNYYSYVKRKVTNDTLYILCLPNEVKTKLQEAEKDYANKSNDLPTNKQQTGSKKVTISSEHNPQFAVISLPPLKEVETTVFYSFTSPLSSSYLNSCFEPPESKA